MGRRVQTLRNMRSVQEKGLGARIQGQIVDPEEKRRYVRRLFGGIAGRYDLTNDVMSGGLHRRWKQLALQIADIREGHVLLDLAAGTGDFALRAAREGRVERVIAGDLTVEMLRAGKTREHAEAVDWLACDALSLPFADRTVDRVMVGYGLRNFVDLPQGLSEIRRVLRPEGKLAGSSRSGWTGCTCATSRFRPPWPGGPCIETSSPIATSPSHSGRIRRSEA